MNKITNWVFEEDCAYRHIVGKDPNDVAHQVALIEKTPRVRIRAHYLGTDYHWHDGVRSTETRRWPEFLDWCYGEKGDGHRDPESPAWCNGMLKAIRYEL